MVVRRRGGGQGACEDPQARRRSVCQTFDAAQTLINDRIGVTGVRGSRVRYSCCQSLVKRARGGGEQTAPKEPRPKCRAPWMLSSPPSAADEAQFWLWGRFCLVLKCIFRYGAGICEGKAEVAALRLHFVPKLGPFDRTALLCFVTHLLSVLQVKRCARLCQESNKELNLTQNH